MVEKNGDFNAEYFLSLYKNSKTKYVPGYEYFRYESEVESTQVLLRKIDEPCIMTCDVQTQGIGRNEGSVWESQKGGLWFTMNVGDMQLSKNTQVQIVAAYSMIQSINQYGVDLGFKWPNDIICQDYKIGGLMIDSFGNDPNKVRFCIGMKRQIDEKY